MKKPNKKQKMVILKIAYVFAVVQPLFVLPQVYEIFSKQSASDVSLTTWSMLLFFNILNFIYGWAFELKPIVISNLTWSVVDVLVVIGILTYG